MREVTTIMAIQYSNMFEDRASPGKFSLSLDHWDYFFSRRREAWVRTGWQPWQQATSKPHAGQGKIRIIVPLDILSSSVLVQVETD